LCKIAGDFEAHADAPISRFMTKAPGTLEGHVAVVFGLNRMTVGGFRHIPITTDKKLSGLVSTRDFFAFMVQRLREISGIQTASAQSLNSLGRHRFPQAFSNLAETLVAPQETVHNGGIEVGA